MSNQQYIQDRIEELKRNLLDLTKRNKLISFKHRAGAKDHIRIIDENINFLYSELADGKSFEFKPLPSDEDIPYDEKTEEFQLFYEDFKTQDEEYLKAIEKISEKEYSQEEYLSKLDDIEFTLINKVREGLELPKRSKQGNDNALIAQINNLNSSFEMPMSSEQSEKKHIDKYIQVLLKPKEMNACLSGIYDYTYTDQKDSGINSCYISFGFLRWYDMDDSSVAVDSPLLLMPLKFNKERTSKGPKYTISSISDGIEVNLTLKEKLKREFDIVLSDIKDDENPEEYILRIQHEISKLKPKWGVKRFVTVARLIYSKSVIFRDLDSSSISKNNLLEKIFSGSEYSIDHNHEVYNIDELENTKDIPELIYDADSSQMSSIIDALDGNSMVIQGPPGTGKSQTIANLIASSIERGKKVLFVAEKMAALEVVHSRLAKKNLDPFCLELHSNKVGTLNVISSLSNRLGHDHSGNRFEDKRVYSEKLTKLKQAKSDLNKYYFNMNNTYSELKIPLKDILGRKDVVMQNLIDNGISKDELDNFSESITISSVNNISEEQFQNTNESLKAFINKFESFDLFNSNIIGFTYKERSPLEIQKTFKDISKIKSLYSKIIIELSNIISEDYFDKISLSDIEKISEKMNLAINFIDTDVYIEQLRVKQDLWDDILELSLYHKKFINSINISDSLLDDINFLYSSFEKYDLNSIEDFKYEINSLNRLRSIMSNNLNSLNDILSLFEERDYTILELSRCLDFLAFLQSIDIKKIKLRSERVLDLDNQELLQSGYNLQEEILNLETTISEFVDIEKVFLNKTSILDSIEYINSQLLQNKINIVSLFKHRSNIAKYSKVKFKNIPLDLLAKYLELNKKLESSSDLESILNINVSKSSNLKDYLDLSKWYSVLCHKFQGINGINKEIRELIKSIDINLLKEINQIYIGSELEEVSRLLSIYSISLLDHNINISNFINDIDGKLKDINKIVNTYDSIIINDSLSLNDISENYSDIVIYCNLYNDLLSELDDNIEISKVADTVNYLKIIFNLGLNSNNLEGLLSDSKNFSLKLSNKFKELKILSNNIIEDLNIMLKDCVFNECFINAESVKDSKVKNIYEKLKYVCKDESMVDTISHYNYTLSELKSYDAKSSIEYLEKNKIELKLWEYFYELSLMNSLIRSICRDNSSISIKKGLDIEYYIKQFKELDLEIQRLQAEKIKNNLLINTRNCFKSGVKTGKKSEWTESSLVNDIIKQKRPRVKVRDLMFRARRTIQELKPCFMMSPLSVSQYLPRDLEFDILIIDEASQMRVEDSIGSIIRANQIVIVGDDKQLPPTSFFSGNNDIEEEDEIEEESILDLAKGKFDKSSLLRWHYRSEHDSLIAYSNYKFYDGKLIAAPSPFISDDMGLIVKNVDGIYSNNKNLEEIKAITNAVREHVYNNDRYSLGVVAVNKMQAESLRDHVESTLQTDAKYIKFCNDWQGKGEPIFFKNLENVQGDERDVIFISTVYGKEAGQTAVHQRFGPINNKGGERRLNVLFTRSKKKMVIFTSLKPDDIKSESNGAKALKGFLEYAYTRRLEQGLNLDKSPDSDFEISVMDRLKSSGFIVEPQVGVSGFMIDIGIKHERYPYGFLCGIECDGATYHSSRSARDRDILRQNILESKGWKIFRVWSTDWFYSPEKAYSILEKNIYEFLDQKEFEMKEAETYNIENNSELDIHYSTVNTMNS